MATEQEKRWVDAWRIAGPELERLRKQELVDMDEADGLKLLGAFKRDETCMSGLATMQNWFMRWRVIELNRQIEKQ